MITLKTLDRTPGLAELKVTYRRGRRRDARQAEMPWVVNSATRAEEYVRTIWDEDTIDLREEFLVVCLTASLGVLGWVRLHTGGLDHSPADPRLVFAVALQTASAAILVAHNHPSGSLEPSEQDIQLTRRLAQGAKLLGLRFLDHVIVTRTGHFSFETAGLVGRDG
jgi:DNA repair protein RadC